VGAELLLVEAIADGMLGFFSTPDSVAGASTVIVTIGTSIDKLQNPSVMDERRVLNRCDIGFR